MAQSSNFKSNGQDIGNIFVNRGSVKRDDVSYKSSSNDVSNLYQKRTTVFPPYSANTNFTYKGEDLRYLFVDSSGYRQVQFEVEITPETESRYALANDGIIKVRIRNADINSPALTGAYEHDYNITIDTVLTNITFNGATSSWVQRGGAGGILNSGDYIVTVKDNVTAYQYSATITVPYGGSGTTTLTSTYVP